jgi:CHASE3 domain sensor protein
MNKIERLKQQRAALDEQIKKERSKGRENAAKQVAKAAQKAGLVDAVRDGHWTLAALQSEFAAIAGKEPGTSENTAATAGEPAGVQDQQRVGGSDRHDG